MKDLEDIESEIESYGSSSEKRWQRIAEMVISVEKHGLWQQKPGNRNFTVWLESLATEHLSKSWLWAAYRAGKMMESIFARRHPQTKGKTVGEMLEMYPHCSVGALNSLKSLEGARVSNDFINYVQDEYLEGKLSVSQLTLIGKETRRCRKLGLDGVEAFAAVQKLDFNPILGLSGTRQRILTDLPAGSRIDAICVLPTQENKPEFLGIAIWKGGSISFPDSVDWHVVIKSNLDKENPVGPFGLIALDFISGRYEVIRKPERVKPVQEAKFNLGLGIINSLLVPSSNPVTV